MKKQAICIQCHNKSEQINYLIKCMPEDFFDFIIHVDSKSAILEEILHKSNVFFTERIDVRWGRFSQVRATLKIFESLSLDEYSYIHLISGNDFIIKSPEYFLDFFENNHKEYIESNLLGGGGSVTWSWKGEDRYSVYYPQWLIRRPSNKGCRFLRILYREFVMRTGMLKRKKMPVKHFYGGSSWFSITSSCLNWMLEYLKEHPEYIEFFEHGVCSDEVFFSTLVQYSPYKDMIANKHLRFMLWEDSSGGPLELKENHIPQMIKSECIFARKITDIKIIEKVYNDIS